ncbi:MAG: peptidoglycan-associated lipoprotein Pal [Zoogloeaceae bacterium]|jgi:peptidoglycan-associated lipoprotein|nr:peptidoglycan-associated lipoprotein Pal [Zoogloeaceae bacterium]
MRTKLMIALVALSAAALIAGCNTTGGGPEQPGASVEDRSAKQVDGAEVKRVTPDQNPQTALDAVKQGVLAKRSVFFDYDSYVVKDEFRPLVEAHAKFLVANPKVKILIQGNADERGSREYNLALGQKRAEALKKMLTLLGAREDQVEAVSLGEEKPRCSEASESCWAQNRRDDMLYSGEF